MDNSLVAEWATLFLNKDQLLTYLLTYTCISAENTQNALEALHSCQNSGKHIIV